MRLITKLFLQGLAVVLPLGLTAYVVYWMSVQSESYLGEVWRSVLPEEWYVPGLGLLSAIGLVFLVGLLMQAWLFRKLVEGAGSLVNRIPFVKSLYGGLRDLMDFVSRMSDKKKLNQVVMVQLTDDVRLLGFITKESLQELTRRMKEDDASDLEEALAVYLPMSYQLGGYTLMIPRSMIDPVDLSVEDAMRFVLTAGMSSKEDQEMTKKFLSTRLVKQKDATKGETSQRDTPV